MKALVKSALGVQNVELLDIPEPTPGNGELKVRVLATGICGSDIHAICGERETVLPVTLGHEYVGQVVETCGDTCGFQVGDWVLTIPACYNCGTCELCRAGLVTLCKSHRSLGFHVNGTMADYLVVPARYSFHVPDTAISLQEKISYALAEPLACIIRGVYEKIDVTPGDTVVVSGPGIMGQFAVQAFKARGAYVFLSGLPQDEEKLNLAKTLGADETVTSLEALKEAVFSRNPDGADITCEATGLIPSLESCMQVIRPLGTHLQIGMFGGKVPCRLDDLFNREVLYVPSNSSSLSAWKTMLALLAQGTLTMEPFVSLMLPLSRWKEGFDAAARKAVYKAVLIPDALFSEISPDDIHLPKATSFL